MANEVHIISAIDRLTGEVKRIADHLTKPDASADVTAAVLGATQGFAEQLRGIVESGEDQYTRSQAYRSLLNRVDTLVENYSEELKQKTEQ